ncbi:MAG: trigger factor [Chloroflexota bacterium]|nr:trigger factor [Chloroflexota bacterium]
MKITTEPLEHCQILMSIEPDEEQVNQALRQAARKISREYQIPGFRKGKAPYSAVVRTYGKEVLIEQVAEDLGDKVYEQALEESGLKPIAPGSMDDITLNPLVYKVILPMPPEVDLGDYRTIRVERPKVEVSEEDVQGQLDGIQESFSEWVPVEDEPATIGHMITMALVGSDGGGTFVEDDAFELILQEEREDFPPGFDQKFVDLKAGENVEFDIDYPEDWSGDRAGVSAHFVAEVHSVKRHDVPEIDDGLAPLVGDYDTLEELTEAIREGLLEQRQQVADSTHANAVMEAFVEAAEKLDFPPVLAEEMKDQLAREQADELQRSGLPLNEYLRLTSQTQEQFREQLSGVAEMRLQSDLVLDKLVEAEGLEVSDEELEEYRTELIESSNDAQGIIEMLDSEGGRSAMRRQILRRKSIDRLLAIADGTALDEPAPISGDQSSEEDALVEEEETPVATAEIEEEDSADAAQDTQDEEEEEAETN